MHNSVVFLIFTQVLNNESSKLSNSLFFCKAPIPYARYLQASFQVVYICPMEGPTVQNISIGIFLFAISGTESLSFGILRSCLNIASTFFEWEQTH